MAYLRTIERKCRNCGKRAAVELINQVNSSNGYYCRICGTVAMNRLQNEEYQENRGNAEKDR
jgi:uncharacterized Zn finger protein